MGIDFQTGRKPATNLVYSSFLGMLYVSTPENEAAVAEAKSLVGDAEVKKGYTPKGGATQKARAFLTERGVMPARISGKLAHAEFRKTEKDGRTYQYVSACLRDSDGLYCLSLPAETEAAQILTRKLANAKFGVEYVMAAYPMMQKSENPAYADREFPKHIVSLKEKLGPKHDDVGPELIGVSPAPIQAMADEAVAKLKETGMDDPDMVSATRKKMAMRFHLALWEDIDAEVAKYKATRGSDEASSGAAPEPAPAMSSFDDEPF